MTLALPGPRADPLRHRAHLEPLAGALGCRDRAGAVRLARVAGERP